MTQVNVTLAMAQAFVNPEAFDVAVEAEIALAKAAAVATEETAEVATASVVEVATEVATAAVATEAPAEMAVAVIGDVNEETANAESKLDIAVDGDLLQKALADLAPIKPVRVTFAAGNSTLDIVAVSDDKVAMAARIPAKAISRGVCTITAKGATILKASLTDGRYILRVVKDEDGTCLTSMSPEMDKLTLPVAKEIARIPAVQNAWQVTLPQSELHRLIHRTAYAADNAKKPLRPIFTGAQVSVANGRLQMITSDTHRAAVATTPHFSGNLSFDVVIPVTLLTAIKPLLSGQQDVTISGDDNTSVEITANGWRIRGRLIGGDFPNTAKIFGEKAPVAVQTSTADLKKAVSFVKPLADENGAITLYFNEDTIEAVGALDKAGTARRIIPAKGYHVGSGAAVSINAKYISETLAVHGAADVLLSLTRSGLNANATDYKAIIVPTRNAEMPKGIWLKLPEEIVQAAQPAVGDGNTIEGEAVA